MNWKSNRDGWVATNVYFVYIVFPSIGELKKKILSFSFSFSFLLFFAHFLLIFLWFRFSLSSVFLFVCWLCYIYIYPSIYIVRMCFETLQCQTICGALCVFLQMIYIYIYMFKSLTYIYIKLSSLHGNTLFYFLHFSTFFFLHFFLFEYYTTHTQVFHICRLMIASNVG